MEKKGAIINPKSGHCIIVLYPVQGHINPIIQFGKRLASKGVRVTLAAPKSLLIKATPELPSSVRVEAISDGYDQGYNGVDNQLYQDSFRRVGTETLSDLLKKLKDNGQPVKCLIFDPFLRWVQEVAKRFGIFAAPFFTQTSSVNIVYYNIHKGLLKVPVLEKETVLAGLGVVLENDDLPSFVRDQESHPGTLELLVDQFHDVEDAVCVFVNTIYELEQEATDWLTKHMRVKTIGPTIPSSYLDKRVMEDKHYGLNVFKNDDKCMKWLDERTTKSVIYVSFGSMAKLEREKMEELALSLKMMDKSFLWVVRSSEESKLPSNFAQETSEKGLIVSWCPQLEVLSHNSICCFVTHCGWNSTLEALGLGVPLVAVPWWSDQSMNAKLVMDVWKTGIRARSDEKNIVRHEEIVRCVKHVTQGEIGEEISRNAIKWKELSREAIDEGGSSDRNIDEFIYTVLQPMPL